MLTGKNKERFESYYLDLPNSMGLNYGNRQTTLNRFYSLPLSMQFGMIQEYADSIGYDVNVAQHAGKFMFLITNDDLDIWEEGFDFKTREEACNAAIKAFDDIVNQK